MIKMPLCRICARLKDFKLENNDRVIAHCEAYPNGIPEAVFYAGHIYPKPEDNDLRFVPEKDEYYQYFLNISREKEDKEYKKLKNYYEELDMSDEEWVKKMMKEKKLTEGQAEALLVFRRRRETEPKIW